MRGGRFFNRDTALAQWGSVLSTMAGTTACFVFAWWVLSATGSVGQFGVILTASTAVQTVVQLFAGALGDRIGPRAVLRCAAVAQTVLVLALTLLVWAGSYELAPALAVNVLLAAANGVVTAMNNPVLAEVSPAGRLAEVMAQRGALVSAGKLAAPALAAAALAVGGGTETMALALAFSAAGTAALLAMAGDRRAGPVGTGAAGSVLGFFRRWGSDTISGVAAFSRIRVDFQLCLMTCGINLALPAYFTVLLPYVVLQVHGWPPSHIGWLDAAFCAGMLVGGRRVVRLLNERVGKVPAVFVSVVVLAGMVVSSAVTSQLPALLVAQFVGGCFMLSIFANVGALRALATPAAYRARVMSAAGFLTSIAMAPGIALCTWVVHAFGATAAALVLAAIVVLAVATIRLIPQATMVLNLSETDAVGAYERLYPTAFGGR